MLEVSLKQGYSVDLAKRKKHTVESTSWQEMISGLSKVTRQRPSDSVSKKSGFQHYEYKEIHSWYLGEITHT